MGRFVSILLSDETDLLHGMAARELGLSFHEHLRLLLQADARVYGLEIGMIPASTRTPTPAEELVSEAEALAAAKLSEHPKPRRNRVGQDILAETIGPQPSGRNVPAIRASHRHRDILKD